MTAARVPTDQLTLALLGLAARGQRTHCSDPTSHHLWLSEHQTERATAVMLCDHCPILTVCRDTAEQRQETWGVWGGKDFSRRPGRAKRLKQAGRDDDLFSVA
jgi:Transcription factor WhiB